MRRDGERLSMDFPSRPPEKTEVHPDLLPALGGDPVAVLAARDYLVRYRSRREVEGLSPAFEGLLGIDKFAVIVTAPGNGDCDFVSRFFAPAKGIPEDPVTGSAHCSLVPYWASELGKTELHARQVSRRGESYSANSVAIGLSFPATLPCFCAAVSRSRNSSSHELAKGTPIGLRPRLPGHMRPARSS